VSRLDLVVGPNGAGKSSFVEHVLAPTLPLSVLVNADEIAKQRWPDDPMTHSYDAARIAEQTRSALIARRRPFIAETVFSHPSKLELITEAHAAGYHVTLHVLMIPAQLAPHRVAARVEAGGHDVPVDKVLARAERLWANVATAVHHVDTALLFDNSTLDGPNRVATFIGGVLVGVPHWPGWTSPELTSRWPSTDPT
jgi:predicted ABC-type ATPase